MIVCTFGESSWSAMLAGPVRLILSLAKQGIVTYSGLPLLSFCSPSRGILWPFSTPSEANRYAVASLKLVEVDCAWSKRKKTRTLVACAPAVFPSSRTRATAKLYTKFPPASC